jgi:hypothetical protein
MDGVETDKTIVKHTNAKIQFMMALLSQSQKTEDAEMVMD